MKKREYSFDFRLWEQRIFSDLNHRRINYDREYNENYKVLNDKSSKGRLIGNLMREFAWYCYSRIIENTPKLTVETFDNKSMGYAKAQEIVGSCLMQITSFKEILKEATRVSSYSVAWVEVTHPAAQWGVNPDFINVIRESPNLPQKDYEEVEPPSGVDLSQIDIFTQDEVPELDGMQSSDDEGIPISPVNDIGIGFPTLFNVKQRHVVIPANTEKVSDVDYICRFRCVTLQQLKRLHNNGNKIDPRNLRPITADVLAELWPEKNILFFNDYYLLAELWIRRDDSNIDNNNKFICWVFDSPLLIHNKNDNKYYPHDDAILRNMINPLNGFIPYVPIVATEIGNFYDNTLLKDMKYLAELYSLVLRSVQSDLERSLNIKIALGDSNQNMELKEKQKLSDPTYSGIINVPDPNGLQPIKQEGFSWEKIQLVTFIRKLAQHATAQSDVDMGQPIKKISASQTQALLAATDEVYNMYRECILKSGEEIVKKLVYLHAMFHGPSREYDYGVTSVQFDPAKLDMSMSTIYTFKLSEAGPNPSETDQMLLIQLLRTLSMAISNAQILSQYINVEDFLRNIFRAFKQDPSTVRKAITNSGMTPEQIQQLMQQYNLNNGIGDNSSIGNSSEMGNSSTIENRPQGSHNFGSQSEALDANSIIANNNTIM